MSEPGGGHAEKVGPFQIVILILSVVVLAALAADSVLKLPGEVSEILQVLDTLVCVLLLTDFGVRFHRAKSKLQFMKWGWIDLLASIPNIPILRVGRFVRILRVIQLIRAIRASHRLSQLLLRDRTRTGVASVAMTSFLLIMFCSVAILLCEQQDPNANIKTSGDALWWSVTTITTVGYGDKYPVTTEGRMVAALLMFSGIGMFGVLSGLAATYFLGSRHESVVREEDKILARLEKLEEKIDRLKEK
jgi:voltage-gated potassium channel